MNLNDVIGNNISRVQISTRQIGQQYITEAFDKEGNVIWREHHKSEADAIKGRGDIIRDAKEVYGIK